MLEADNKTDADKEPTEDVGNELEIDPEEVQMLKQIIKPAAPGQPSTTPKSGDKWGLTHLDGSSGSSDKIDPADLTSINTRYHSTYLEVARADSGSVIKKSVFCMVAYCATLKQ